jgi:hypothetical protein
MEFSMLDFAEMSAGAVKGGQIGDAIFYMLLGVAMLFVRYKKEVMRPSFVIFMRIFGVGVILSFLVRIILLLRS